MHSRNNGCSSVWGICIHLTSPGSMTQGALAFTAGDPEGSFALAPVSAVSVPTALEAGCCFRLDVRDAVAA